VREWAVLQLGDDLLDDGVVAVGGLRGQHRFARGGEHGGVAVDRERCGLLGRHMLGLETVNIYTVPPGSRRTVAPSTMTVRKASTATPAPMAAQDREDIVAAHALEPTVAPITIVERNTAVHSPLRSADTGWPATRLHPRVRSRTGTCRRRARCPTLR
jgi:hypothetical protein